MRALELAVFILHVAGDNGVAVIADGQRASEVIAWLSVRGRETHLLRPGPLVAREDVNGASTAILTVRAHAEGVAVAVQADGVAEQYIRRGRVPGLDVSLLRPGVAAAIEDEHRAGIRCTRVLLVAVDACGVAGKIGRASVGKECRSRWSPYH